MIQHFGREVGIRHRGFHEMLCTVWRLTETSNLYVTCDTLLRGRSHWGIESLNRFNEQHQLGVGCSNSPHVQ